MEPTGLRRLETTNRELSVTLTPEELAERSMRLAEQHRSLREAKNRLAGLKDQEKAVKGGIDWLEGEMESLAAVIEAGEEDRDVSCTWYAREDLGVKVLLRDDTGQEVDRRSLELLDTQAAQEDVCSGTEVENPELVLPDGVDGLSCAHCMHDIEGRVPGHCETCGGALCLECMGDECPNQEPPDAMA